ncbi:hypothetical protein [Desulfobacter curvatus]|uniref:hypothetical protein n=1 Tax=Desulfobacter curvatus TaxID=2290 RepID=UPI00037C79FE|nr:hypothetical protein [Desulfobacter curvatus]
MKNSKEQNKEQTVEVFYNYRKEIKEFKESDHIKKELILDLLAPMEPPFKNCVH